MGLGPCSAGGCDHCLRYGPLLSGHCEGPERSSLRDGPEHPVMTRDCAAALVVADPSHCDLAIATVAETDGAVPGNGFQTGDMLSMRVV